MNPDMLSYVAKLSDQELLTRLELLAQREREATTALIAILGELDERRLYLGEGCSSLFTYCTQVLHFSERSAYRRIEAARAARKYPVVLEMLSAGSINLTTITLLAPELTPANHKELLEAAKYKSRKQVEKLVARLRPQPPVPSTIRRLPTRNGSFILDPSPAVAMTAQTATPPALHELPVRPPARPVVVPLAPRRYKIQFTASEETHEKLRLAQDLLRHQIPDGDLEKVIGRALAALIRDLKKEKIGATERPRGGRTGATLSRHISAAVRRVVWERDGGQCAFVSPNGCRCTERGFLEFHHVVPYAVGGEATVENIQLRCRAHNGYEAELYFGPPGPDQVVQ